MSGVVAYFGILLVFSLIALLLYYGFKALKFL
ncbi:MAG TPA: cytochrome b6f complex subunit PetL [Geminocystis sp. M7585_C2015_104]|nr:cytochrome b6f complex subunit PetL [Geminocystis sp. M7585_C2015_104]